MLTTGVRTPVGLKISGADVQQIEKIRLQAEALLNPVSGTCSVFTERTGGGYFLDYAGDPGTFSEEPDGRQLSRPATEAEPIGREFSATGYYEVRQRLLATDAGAVGAVLRGSKRQQPTTEGICR